MLNKTIDAQVVNGHLQHQELLPAFEGQKVRVQVIAPSLPIQQRQEAPPRASDEPPSCLDEEKDLFVTVEVANHANEEPPPQMDVEKEIYIKMPRKVEILTGVTVIDKGRRRPHFILPEELPND